MAWFRVEALDEKGLIGAGSHQRAMEFGGAKGSRTPDLLHAMQALSQLSYGPIRRFAGTGGLGGPPDSAAM